jgi:acetyl-CoA carboxylase carboxyl transferase subunit alpha
MMQYSTYSVISPEGCAAILWKSAENAGEAADSLGITAPRLKALGVIDKVIPEPLGGAHRDPAEAAKSLKKAIQESLRNLQDLSAEQLLERRQERWVNYGKFKEIAE